MPDEMNEDGDLTIEAYGTVTNPPTTTDDTADEAEKD
jgi:hypothetical protein